MLDENEVRLRGHLGEEPRITVHNGVTFASLQLATNRRWRDKAGEQKEETTWHDVEVFGRQAEFIRARQLRKGAFVEVRGRIRKRSWEKDGQRHYRTDVVALQFSDMSDLGRKQAESGDAAEPEF